MREDLFLIEKRGLYYRPKSAGYTGIKAEAGRYSFEEAAVIVGPNGPEGPQDGLAMWREDDAPDYSPNCCWEARLRHENATLKAENKDLRNRLLLLEHAAKEEGFFVAYVGGGR